MAELPGASGPTTDSFAKFFDLCKVFESILGKTKNEHKRERMGRYIDEWRQTGGDFFPALRLILPHLDKARTTYGMKDKVLAKVYVEVMGIAPTSPDAESLINWRNPGKSGQKAAGDFPTVLFNVVSSRSNRRTSSVSIADINDKLDILNTTNDKDERKEVVQYFFKECTPKEQMWIARIILKELKLGISEATILALYHPDALDLFNVCSDLAQVTAQLKDPTKRLAQQEIQLFRPFKPMLSRKSLPQEVPKMMENQTFWVETKLDGERLQMHSDNTRGEYRWFSRKATDYTRIPRVKSLILDGEMRAYNTETEMFEPFGNLKTASNDVQRLGESSILRPCFHVFDILYCNGKSLVDTPLSDRYSLLAQVIKEKKNVIEIVPHEVGRTVEDVVKLLDEHMMRCEEGLMVKNPTSPYVPSSRGEWLKIKPDYIDALGDDLDVILVGGFYGEGRRSGKLSHFMCAILEDPKPDGSPRRLLTFCKFGTGFKMHEIEMISRESQGHWIDFDRRKWPSWFVHPTNGEMPHRILPPEHCRVVQLKAAEITKTDQYQTGWTLRFPRYVCMRDDKRVEEALSVSQLHEYIRQNQGRMQSRRLQAADFEAREKKKRKVVARRAVATVRLANEYRGVNVKSIERADDLFRGWEGRLRSKRDVEAAVVRHGGTVVQNPEKGTRMIVADQHTLKVSNLKKVGKYDIVQSRYISDCISAGAVKPLNARYMIYTTDETRENFKKNADKWGDEYVENLTEASLWELFNTMTIPLSTLPTRKRNHLPTSYETLGIDTRHATITEIEEHYFSMTPHEGSLFRNCIMYLDRFTHLRVHPSFLREDFDAGADVSLVLPDTPIEERDRVEDSWLDVLAVEIRARGGVVVDLIGVGVTLV
ncbi:DNA ligase (ATP), partial [Rhizophlyctis rosea]